jgi:Outer membrane protein beta-barrel domain
MEHLDNDMDDLFQKAGELYPLKTTESDWDAVAGKLQNESFGDVNNLPGLDTMGTRNKRKWLLLLLLIPLGFGIVYTAGLINQKHSVSELVKPSGAREQNKSSIKTPQSNTAVTEQISNKTKEESNKIQAPSGNISTEVGNSKKEMPSTNGKTQIYAGGAKHFTKKGILNMPSKMISNGSLVNNDLNSKNGNRALEETERANANKQLNNASTSNIESIQNQKVLPVPPPVTAQNEIAADKKNPAPTETSKSASPDSSLAKKRTKDAMKHSKGFYVGLIAGPDLSTVKFQSVKNLGLSLGVLVGYRFNNRLSVETGLIWDKKYYYSTGEYFKNSTLPTVPASTKVNGSCTMFEIPIDLRYDFAIGNNHRFFAKVGLSSYLSMNDKYTFQTWNNSYPSPPYPKTDNILSILQVSGGYEHSINAKTKIRVEPYMKIPLKGVGTGSMPISSFGLYLGITHSFR